MRFTLKDYQDEAVAGVLANLDRARRRWHQDGDPQAFALSAATGAGKTVIAAAVIEALFFGAEDHNFAPDPGAVVVWFSDDPALNEQTRFRLLEASDLLGISSLRVVENTFNQEELVPGTVYFLNTQKLSRTSLLTRGHDPASGDPTLPGIRPDARSYTIWDTIQNTIADPDLTLYLVLDEAHRGLGSGSSAQTDRATIVRRLIDGNGAVSAVPVVWGISATIERFISAVGQMPARSKLPDVTVPTSEVQESGLVKDNVILDIPDETGAFETVLVRRATRKLVDSTAAWEAYTTEQGIEPVLPLMVLQVPNVPDPDDIGRALEAVRDEWPEFSSDHVAHVLGEHRAHTFGAYQVPYISPERVQESTWVRMLIAKDAISTGWDCPRAEVMVSFRPAKDKTHITQLLGRLVRSPLARRVPGNDRLNSVECLLPHFDKRTVTAVVNALVGNGPDAPPPVRRVLVNPMEMTPNPEVPDEVWKAFVDLPSESVPRRAHKPVKRLTALAHELAADGLVPGAGRRAHQEMHRVLDAAAVRYGDKVSAKRAEVLVLDGLTITAGLHGTDRSLDAFVEAADLAVIEDAYRRAARILGADLCRTYAEHLAARHSGDDDDEALVEAHTTIAGLGMVDEVKAYLDTEADRLATRWFSEYRVAIRDLPHERQEAYRQIQEMSSEPQPINLVRPSSRVEPTVVRAQNGTETPIATFERHLLADADGRYPMETNDWEDAVLRRELGRRNSLGWYRNPSRSSHDSLAIAYQDGDRWRTLRPDFVFFTEGAQGAVNSVIVDPHGHHLADALPKLKGLARYAAEHDGAFQRIESISKIDGVLRLLDLTKPAVREAVLGATDAGRLYRGTLAEDYEAS